MENSVSVLYRDDDEQMAGYIAPGHGRVARERTRADRGHLIAAYRRLLCEELLDTLPESHERDLAIDRLRESQMWAEAALSGPRVPVDPTD